MARAKLFWRGLQWSAWALAGAMVMSGWLLTVMTWMKVKEPAPPPPAQAHLLWAGEEPAREPVRVRVVTVASAAGPTRKVSTDRHRVSHRKLEACAPEDPVVVRLGARRWEIEIADESALCHLDRMALGCGRVVPSYESGTVEGYKIFPRPDGLAARLGLRPGDVILRVNGQALTTPDAALEAYRSVSFPLEVELRRRAETITHTYALRPRTLQPGR